MKVERLSGIKAARRVTPPAKADRKEERDSEKVSKKGSSQLESVKQAAKRAGEQQHAERLQELEAQIRAGSYRPDPGRIADEILRAAELHAQISLALN